ncbi:MAG: hypothetical protein IPJ77_14675 [Planctomycetes bacterium]|nr:hypothetical protein [Planctomycetota bacterium]
MHVFDEQGKLSFETSSGPATMSEDARHRSFGWTADGRKFVTVSHAGLVEVRDATDGRVLLAFEAPDECYGHFARLHVAPDGERFVASYSEVELAYVWSASEGRAGELRIPTESAGEPVAWLAADELAVATPRGVDVLALGASTTSRIDGTGPGADVYADSASGRLAIVQEAHLTLVERR